jgi:hypothetical protein
MGTQPAMVASYLGTAAGNPLPAFMMFGSPQLSGTIHDLDPDKVKEVRFAMRTKFESRVFSFTRDNKDRPWTDASNLKEFEVDSEKVSKIVKELCELRTDRFVAFAGGPRGEHKLGAKEATMKIDLSTFDGRAITLTIGTNYLNHGYFATSSLWPETVFFLPNSWVESLLEGARNFGKDRTAMN